LTYKALALEHIEEAKPSRKKAVKRKTTQKVSAKEKVKSLKSRRLFKKFFLGLDEGLFLVSNANESFRLHREIYKVNRGTLETYQ
jgi:hypothetical protein